MRSQLIDLRSGCIISPTNLLIVSVLFAAVPTGHASMPRKNAIIACKGIPNQSKAGTHGMSHMGAGFVCMGLFPRPRAGKIIQ